MLAGSVMGAMVAVAAPVATATAGGAPSVACTFDGKAGPASITGVVPGTTSFAIVCTGTPKLGLAAIMASPLGGVVIPPASATNEADISSLTSVKQTSPGTYKGTFHVPASFSASDTNAVCPPSVGQFNAGLVGCPVAVINTANLTPFPNEEAILETTAQKTPPKSPTVATASSTVTAGEHITFADATGACPDNPTAASQCWWGDGLAASSTSAKTLSVTLDGKSVSGATATVSGAGTDGRSTYNGTTLVPQSLSGSLTLPGGLSAGTHTLTVTQTNVTPFDGNGHSPKANSPISASTTLVVGTIAGPLVTAVSPSTGTSAGGSSVTISGTNFTGATAVHFGTAAAKFTVSSSTSISATAPAGKGAVDVTVTTPHGTSFKSDADRFVYVAPSAPVVTGVGPTSGTQDGGTAVAISGLGFKGTTAVHFGSALAKSFKVHSDSELEVTSPSGSGTVNVTVTSKLGTSKTTTAGLYSYLPGPAALPTVTGVSPAVGIKGTVVTVTGTGLSRAKAVDFGTAAAKDVTVDSDTTLTATAPAGSVTGSPVDITVTTPAGKSVTSSADQFTYVNAPVVSSVSPNAGSPLGGYQISINGSGFTGATKVKFGTVLATSFTFNGDSSITATVPAGTGTVAVTVRTPAGVSARSSNDEFSYGAPVVTGVSPNAGSPLGGDSVSVTGTGFTGATAVDFGTAHATHVVVSSDDSLTATSPAGTGTVDVTVKTAAGTSATSLADQFDYAAQPTVTGVSSNQGPDAGGNLVDISGTSLTGATAVDFGSENPASDVTVISDTLLTAEAPAGTGTVDVTVTVPSGTSSTSVNDEYTYFPVPTVTGLSVSSGPAPGNTTVVITGTGFTSATQVDFGTNNGASFTVNSDTSINATSPSSPIGAGAVDVTVTNPGGTSVISPADAFTYLALPSVSSVFPPAGPLAGGTQVYISGTGFTPSTTVEFGSSAGTDVTYLTSGLMTATSPSGSTTVDVTVTNGVGTSLTSGADQFTYQGVPTVTLVGPANGPVSGGTSVSITGTNMLTTSEVDFGGVASPSFSVTSPTTITATAPSSVVPGEVDITVVTLSGTSSASVADEFTYLSLPTVTDVSPPSGPVTGGTSVSITGTGFTTASAVTFGGTPATSFTVNSDTSITATAPPQTQPAPFGVSVQVTTAGGTAGNGADDDVFTYTTVVPTITSVSPNTNTTAGDSLITITGNGFTTDATVSFGADGQGNSVTVNSSTSLTVNSPVGVPGTVDLTVTTSGGTSAITAADHFTYVTETTTLTITNTPGGNTPGSTVTITGSGFPTGNWAINNSGIVLVQADPLAAFLKGFSAIEDLDVNNFVEPVVDNNGDFTAQFTLEDPFVPIDDPNGTCPPLQNEIDVGLVGCAVVALSLNPISILANLGDVPVIYAGTQPDPPTLAVPSTVVHVGNTLHFSGSGWWGSYPGGGATARICGIGGNSKHCDSTTGSGVVAPVTYSGIGGSLHGATLTGSITIASNLAGCTTCFLTVIQPNLTPLPGKVKAEIALTILPVAPTVISVSPSSGTTGGGFKVLIRGTGFADATAVAFGSTPATRFTRLGSTEIVAIAPKHDAGVIDVTVSNLGGRSATSVRDGFTYKT
ncbi:MAG: beta strand repeat-containing protein [Acidimicrobiales bacterium]